MFRIFLFFLPFLCLQAESVVVDYRVEFGIVGEVAKVHSIYEYTATRYHIDVYVETVGMLAKIATHNLKEHHISKGSINKHGLHLSDSFEMLKTFGAYRSYTLYSRDRKKQKIFKTYKKWLIQAKHKERIIQNYTYALPYYATQDMITLFLNLSQKIKNKIIPKRYTFKAIGEDRKNGRVDVSLPPSIKKREMIELLDPTNKGEWLMNVVMHRQLYNSKNGTLMVRMGQDNLIQKAVLKDILFYGDVRIIRQK